MFHYTHRSRIDRTRNNFLKLKWCVKEMFGVGIDCVINDGHWRYQCYISHLDTVSEGLRTEFYSLKNVARCDECEMSTRSLTYFGYCAYWMSRYLLSQRLDRNRRSKHQHRFMLLRK
jgi:hypothetical protein